MIEKIINEIKESINVKNSLLEDIQIINQINNLVDFSVSSLNKGNKIIFCGNGGSFADSQHLTAEFVSRLRFDRSPLAAIALGTNSSNITAIGNDYGYDKVFEREIIALGSKGDLFIPISTSGNSTNVIKAINIALSDKGILILEDPSLFECLKKKEELINMYRFQKNHQ